MPPARYVIRQNISVYLWTQVSFVIELIRLQCSVVYCTYQIQTSLKVTGAYVHHSQQDSESEVLKSVLRNTHIYVLYTVLLCVDVCTYLVCDIQKKSYARAILSPYLLL